MNEYTAGHRQRVKEKFLKNQSAFGDYELLELLLMYSIPRIDVKPIAKDLLRRFCSLENVFNATPEQLMQVKGVGENSAILINLFSTVKKKISKNKNDNVTHLDSNENSIAFFANYFENERNEQIIAVSLDNSNKIIATRVLSNGLVNASEFSLRKIVDMVAADNPSSIIVSHNHPRGKAEPSAADISFTIKIRDFLRSVNVSFLDHIVVGEDKSLSMRASRTYSKYFK